MKKFIFGLVAGLVIGGIVLYVAVPKVKQTSYDSGFEAGNKQGIATGTTAGIAQGVADLQAKEKHERDSVAVLIQKREATRKAAIKPKKKPEVIQNWHVIDGQIAEPVVDTSKHEAAPKK